MELKKKILDSTIVVFNQKGLKFTMDDIAKELGISKKTIYTVFDDKEELFLEMVDYVFDEIKKAKESVLKNEKMNYYQKLKGVLSVLPKGYKNVDFGKLYSLREKYPNIYHKVAVRLETGWEGTLSYLEYGINNGYLKEFNLPMFKVIFEATVERFFQNDVLSQCGLSYKEGLECVVDILVDGIVAEQRTE